MDFKRGMPLRHQVAAAVGSKKLLSLGRGHGSPEVS